MNTDASIDGSRPGFYGIRGAVVERQTPGLWRWLAGYQNSPNLSTSQWVDHACSADLATFYGSKQEETKLPRIAWRRNDRNKWIYRHGNTEGERLWVLPVEGGTAKPIGAQVVLMPMGNNAAISPDGKSVLASSDHGLCLVPISGGEIRTIPHTDTRTRLLRWDLNGKSFLSYQRGNLPQQIFRTDAATGVLWKTVDQPDHTGLNGVGMLRVTPDGRYLAFMDSQTYSDLFYIDLK